jgi:uncharacterized protein (TIGR02284 family)
MANDVKDIRSTMNDLIETNKDGEEGFRACAEHVKDSELRTVFNQYSLQRSRFAGDLQAEVLNLGTEPEKSGSTAGTMHRGWMELKGKIAGYDDHAILEECERGEDSAVKNYREALGKDLPNNLEQIIQSQYKEVQAAHNNIRALRDGRKTVVSSSSSRL